MLPKAGLAAGGVPGQPWSSAQAWVRFADEMPMAQLARALLIIVMVNEAGERPPSRWIWLLVFLPPGGFFFWGDWIGEHAPAWVENLVIGVGFPLLAFMTYRLQWPQGYRHRRRQAPKHRRDDEPL